jgi:DNA polymerase (family 10)
MSADIAAQFNQMVQLLEIEGANPFRIRAYRRAATTVEDLPESITKVLAEGRKLNELPGIGDDLDGKIRKICETGHLAALEEVEARSPSALAALRQSQAWARSGSSSSTTSSGSHRSRS